MVLIEPLRGGIIQILHFDTNFSKRDSEEFAKRIEWVVRMYAYLKNVGFIVVLCSKDDFTENLTEEGLRACESLGATKVRNARYRDSWCCIGIKGASPGSIQEAYSPAKERPTPVIELSINLSESKPTDHAVIGRPYDEISAPHFDAILPSNGRWIRRRKNDGALNRVPQDFYPKVWALLTKTTGIKVGCQVMNSEPTISESTPEEFNFALQVENLLDNIRDPAERQVAVECLVIIARIEERNPEVKLKKSMIDLSFLINDAIALFWQDWAKNHLLKTEDSGSEVKPASNYSEGAKNGLGVNVHIVEYGQEKSSSMSLFSEATGDINLRELTPEKKRSLARKLFFDVPQEGESGTSNYLAFVCMKSIFGIKLY